MTSAIVAEPKWTVLIKNHRTRVWSGPGTLNDQAMEPITTRLNHSITEEFRQFLYGNGSGSSDGY